MSSSFCAGGSIMGYYQICLTDKVGNVTLHTDHDCAHDATATTFALTPLLQRAQYKVRGDTRLVGQISAPSDTAGSPTTPEPPE